MAVKFVDQNGDRVLALHIPKTGGMWLKKVMVAAGAEYTSFDPYKQDNHHGRAWDYDPAKHYLVTVRHPVSWYESAWCFLKRRGLRITQVGSPLWSPDCLMWEKPHLRAEFNAWVDALVDREPRFLYRTYREYIMPCLQITQMNRGSVYLMRQENLLTDASMACNERGLMLDYRKAPVRFNQRPSSMPKPEWSPTVLAAVVESERKVIDEFYHGREEP